jgi:hypothetical protein
VTVACVVTAEKIRAGTAPFEVGHAKRSAHETWAQQALANPASVADSVFWAVLGANASATVEQITGASDAAIQTNTDAVVEDLLAI